MNLMFFYLKKVKNAYLFFNIYILFLYCYSYSVFPLIIAFHHLYPNTKKVKVVKNLLGQL